MKKGNECCSFLFSFWAKGQEVVSPPGFHGPILAVARRTVCTHGYHCRHIVRYLVAVFVLASPAHVTYCMRRYNGALAFCNCNSFCMLHLPLHSRRVDAPPSPGHLFMDWKVSNEARRFHLSPEPKSPA